MVSNYNPTDHHSRCDDVVHATSKIRGMIDGGIHEVIVTRFFHCFTDIHPFDFLGSITPFRHGRKAGLESNFSSTSHGGVR